jgi:transposase InsO family protein
MGRVGASGDNAAMESFFALLQKNVLDRHRWNTREELRWRSSPGSNAPTTADAANAASADSHRSNTRHSTSPLPRPDHPTRRVN